MPASQRASSTEASSNSGSASRVFVIRFSRALGSSQESDSPTTKPNRLASPEGRGNAPAQAGRAGFVVAVGEGPETRHVEEDLDEFGHLSRA